ncbi:cytochrome c oxidase assembly protein [uncultured Aquabacterium sp.]|jgi:cytochrome c oxidase assembly protein subunit 11|uniref:cytochrome c oxidase assembly protein n=1 Tax=uncultured Aquabacterium sp. TaxID=158753 RepID=UPI0026377EC5|nr:cytochrome c oxidase assembly protein [uncultured Aquabacterium sp.]
MSVSTPPHDAAWRRALRLHRANRDTVFKLVVVAGLMFGFGYAMVPMYRHICAALGINVLTLGEQKVPGAVGERRNTQVDLSRTVTIEFDANARGPWDFKPEVRSVRVHPGELTTVVYEFRNRQDRTMAAQAIPSYAPKQATSHFTKLECFCFAEHKLQPGESKRWPVTFVIDPRLPKDVRTITLSYTFFEVGGRVPAVPGGSV